MKSLHHWEKIDKISHEKFLCTESSYFSSELDNDSWQFLHVDKGNNWLGTADVISNKEILNPGSSSV